MITWQKIAQFFHELFREEDLYLFPTELPRDRMIRAYWRRIRVLLLITAAHLVLMLAIVLVSWLHRL